MSSRAKDRTAKYWPVRSLIDVENGNKVIYILDSQYHQEFWDLDILHHFQNSLINLQCRTKSLSLSINNNKDNENKWGDAALMILKNPY